MKKCRILGTTCCQWRNLYPIATYDAYLLMLLILDPSFVGAPLPRKQDDDHHAILPFWDSYCPYVINLYELNEPQHEKINNVAVRRLIWVWSLSAWRKLGSLATHWAHSEDSDQTEQMPRLIWVFAGRTLTLLVLSCCSSNTAAKSWEVWYMGSNWCSPYVLHCGRNCVPKPSGAIVIGLDYYVGNLGFYSCLGWVWLAFSWVLFPAVLA